MDVVLFIMGFFVVVYIVDRVRNSRNGNTANHSRRSRFNEYLNEKLKLDQQNPEGKRYCAVVDVETNGLPASRDLPVTKNNLDGFPDIVELGWAVFTKEGEIVTEGDSLIRQKARIPKKAMEVHGITDKDCEEHGEELPAVLKRFADDIKGCQMLVGHNVRFDKKIIEAELLRTDLPLPFRDFEEFDTMKEEKKPLGSSKYPKLTELHQELLGSDLDKVQNHRALVDVKLTAQLFFFFQWIKR